MTRSRASLLVLAVLCGGLAACNGDESPAPAGVTSAPPPAAATTSATPSRIPSPSRAPAGLPSPRVVVETVTETVTRTVTVRPPAQARPRSFSSCSEMRKWFPYGVQEGVPEYRAALDTDSNGHACEPTQP